MYRALFFGLLFLILTPIVLQAGWVITEKNADAYDVQVQTIYMQENMILLPGKQETLIMDLDSGLLTFVLENHHAYWKGPITDFSAGMVEALEMQLALILPQIPDDQREEYERVYRQGISEYENGHQNARSLENVTLTKTEDSKEILGYLAFRHEVKLNDILVEQLWLTHDIHPFEEINYDKFLRMLDRMTLKQQSDYTQSATYKKVLLTGYPLHAIKYDEEEKLHTLATSIEEKDLALSTFDPPENYSKMPLKQLMSLVLGN